MIFSVVDSLLNTYCFEVLWSLLVSKSNFSYVYNEYKEQYIFTWAKQFMSIKLMIHLLNILIHFVMNTFKLSNNSSSNRRINID